MDKFCYGCIYLKEDVILNEDNEETPLYSCLKGREEAMFDEGCEEKEEE